MKKKLSGKTKITVIVLAVLMLCIAAIVAVSLFVREDKLEELQNDAIAELERNEGQYDERSIVLRSTSKARAEELAALFGAELRITENGRYARLTLPEGVTVKDVWSVDENRQFLEEMSADYQVRISDVEEEEDTSRLPLRPDYTVSDADYALQTYLDYINMQNLWYNYTGTGVTVAVIDTGIDTDHPEFAGRISEYSYNATEDKIVKDWGYDWSLIEDEQGHGTAVTGVIAGTMNSGNITGIAPNVNILVIKAECAPNGSFYRTSDLVFGLYYAIERDVQVVNMSFGTSDPMVFAEAAQLAYDSDIICVAAAGNDGTSALTYPAADPNVIGVGALAENSWSLADYSNYGDNSDLVAPGTVYTSLKDGAYGTMDGTSFSSPVTAAAIALFMQNNRYMTFDEVTEVLFASSYDLGALGNDWDYGFGALDVYSFVCGQRGTVTYDMLTDELENEEGLFIRGIALQELPEPERLYAVFDGWYYDDTFTEAVDYYADAFEGDLTLYAKWVNEDDGVPYTYVILDDGTVEIRSYTGHRRFITVPEMIEGRIVSSVGDFAFAGQARLREVTLPSGLNKIGRYAFQNCSNLVTMHIPVGVKTIGEYAFASNVRLYTFSFDANSVLETIGAYAFANCGNLERIELPATLTRVDGSAFYGTTSLTSINVRSGNTSFISIDGVLFDITASTLVAYPAAHGTTYTVPASTVNIASLAFPMARLKSIDLGQVQTIGGQAFIYSTLDSLSIPDSVVSVGNGAFASNSSLSSLIIGRGLNSISVQSFANCVSLNTVLVPNNIVIIGAEAFAGSGLNAVVFENGSNLAAIEDSAFFNCNISAIDVPELVTVIGAGAFCANPLVSVTFAENAQLHTIGAEAFAKCNLLETVTLPESLRTIGDKAFMSSALKAITVPAGVTSLGYGAFACCNALTSIEIAEGNTVYHDINGVVYTLDNTKIHMYPAGREEAVYTIEAAARSISPWAFAGTAKLGCAVLPEGMYLVDEYAFYLCGATTYVLPSTLTHIMAHAFDTSYNLNSLILPEALVQIAEYAFCNCSALPYIQIPDNVLQIGRFAFSECWNLYTVSFNSTAKLPRISYGAFAYSGINYFTVPANVSTIAQGAFEGCKNLYSVTFAENSKLESISAYMFDGCSNLQSIVFMPGSALTSIQAHGLEGMDRLNYIDFGDAKLTNVDNFAFRFCESLSNITFPETLTNIGRYAFYGCKNLSELTVPANVEHIGSYAFLGTNSLNLYLSADSMPEYLDENWDHGIAGYYVGVTSVNTLGDYKYATLTSGNIAIIEYLGTAESVDLTTLNLGAPITAIGGSAFKDSTVKSIVLPETLTEIQAEAFMYTALESINIPTSVTFIGREAFAHTDIATLNIPTNSSLKYIEQYAFEGTDNLKLAILPASLEKMGTGAFMESGLESVVFADGIKLEEIPQRAFAETKLIAVSLPDSVTLVNHNAFNSVETLQSVSFGNNDGIRLMSNAFYHTGLTSLNIPANVTYIGEYCFVALKNLTAFTVDANNPNYTAIDGLLTTKSGRKLIAVPAGKVGTLNVPVSIEEIGFGAFEESSLSAINFDPNANILTFGYRAFFKAENITEMNIPASVVSIDYYAFAYCENLTTVNFAEGNKLKGIYEGAFCGCINLSNIVIPDSIVEISDFAFYGCSKITKLPISENNEIKGIYDYAFAYTGLSGEFTTPETLIDIGNYAFLGCRFTKVTIPDTNKKQLLIGIGAFEGCNKLTEITVPFIGASFEDEEISWFGYIFGAGSYEANETYVPTSLKTVTVTDGITFVGIGGFAYCTGLENINVPHSVSVLWNDAFANTTARYELTNVITAYSYQWNNTIYKYVITCCAEKTNFGSGISGDLTFSDVMTGLGEWCFSRCQGLTSIELSEGITNIEDYAFDGCINLKSIKIPKSVIYIGFGAFYDCNSLMDIYIADLESWLKIPVSHGSTPMYNNTIKRLYVNGKLLTKLIIPEGIVSIPEFSFNGCADITNVTISDGVETIGNYAFQYCTSITQIEMSNTVIEIGDNAFANCKKLIDIKLSDNLTIIGRNSFENCQSMRMINIPNNVKNIGVGAFQNCVNLNRINIPDGVSIVEVMTFYGCSSLSNIIIPEGVTSIGYSAFYNCRGLLKASLPSTLNNIDFWAFEGCPLLGIIENNSSLILEFNSETNGSIARNAKKIIDSNGNTMNRGDVIEWDYIDTVDGFRFLIENDSYVLVAYLGTDDTITLPTSINNKAYTISYFRGGKNIIVPEGVVSLGADAFRDFKGLESVTLPNSLRDLGSSTFSGCSSLKKVILPYGLETIGYDAFKFCISLETIDIPYSVQNIENNAFYGCTLLESVYLPDSVTLLGDNAFEKCTSLKNIRLSENLQTLSQHLFNSCESLIEIDIPEKVQYISGNVFNGCHSLKEVIIPYGIKAIYPYTFASCFSLEKVVIPDSVKYIEDSAFSNCHSLKNVSLPEGTEDIGSSAFVNCYDLETVVIPKSLSLIQEGVWANCISLNRVIIPYGITSIGPSAFNGCKALTEVIIPESVTSIGRAAFADCINLNSVVIPNSVSDIGQYAFSNVPMITIKEDNHNYKLIDGILYDITLTYIVAVTEDIHEVIVLPDSIVDISQVFSNNKNIVSITLPRSVATIDSYAFYGCTELVEVLIQSDLSSIGYGAFENCTKLNTISFQSISAIDSRAFANCISLTRIELPTSLNTIESEVFYSCVALQGVVIPEGVTMIGSRAFYECISLEYVDIASSVVTIGNEAFANCRNLKKLILRDGLQNINDSAFSNCQSLQNVTLPNTVTHIESWAFWDTSLRKVTLSENLSYVGGFAFSSNTLFEIINPSPLELSFGSSDCGNIAQHAIAITNSDGSVVYRDGYEIVETADGFKFILYNGEYTLIEYLGCDDTVVLPEKINGNIYSIRYFEGAEHVIIPEGFAEIHDLAFSESQTVRSVKIPDSVSRISASAFTLPPEDSWINGVYVVDGWLVKVAKDTEYIDNIYSIRGCVDRAYDNSCYQLKNAVWDGSIIGTSNVETLVVTQLIGQLPTMISFKNIILTNSFDMSDLRYNTFFFSNLTNVTIFVEQREEDLRWDANFPGWNNGNVVVYGDDWHWVNFYDENGMLIYSEPVRNAAVIKPPVYIPEAEGEFEYVLLGWDLDGDGQVDSIPATSIVDIEAHAIVAKVPASYTIKFMAKDRATVIASYDLPYGADITAPEVNNILGYSFIGWTGYTEGMTVESDITFYSEWSHNGGSHQYIEVPMAPTCTEQGGTLHFCTVCAESYLTDMIPATGHSFGEWIVDAAPSCTVTGTKHRLCACGEVENAVAQANGHSYDITIVNPSTCETAGTMLLACRVCGDAKATQAPIKNHGYVKEIIPSDMMNWFLANYDNALYGYEAEDVFVYRCSECARIMTVSESETNSSGVQGVGCKHVAGDWTVIKPASCQNGLEASTCILCGENLDARIILATGAHSFVPKVVNPQFGVQGYTLYTCSACGHSYKDNYTDALTYLPGDIDGTGTVDATDAETILKYITGHDVEVVEDALDVNGDGVVNIRDAATILLYLEGKKVALN